MGALIGIAAGALLLTVILRGETVTKPTSQGGNWQPPERAAPYLDVIRETEQAEGLPHNLLARLLWQESRYRADIIEGRTVSSAGAVGIAQIVPRWHPNVNPLDPIASIRYAGQYLRDLYSMFGNWEQALAAYNWGPGNLSKVKNDPQWLARAPLETRNYVTQITGDVLA